MMDEIDMSRPGTELFPEESAQGYNSYVDTQQDYVDNPLDTGVGKPDVAGQENLSEQQTNFRALREEVAKFKEEKEYWKGQAEAYSKIPSRQQNQEENKADAMNSLDFDDSQDVKKAFDSLRHENDRLRREMQDAITAIQAKSQHQDWDNMVTQHVPQLTSKNPIFAEMIQKASNPYEAAYLLAELNAKASQQGQAHPQQPGYNPNAMNAQRAINNAQKPQTLSSVGGNGTLSSADYYASMSDEDFMKVASRNMANI